MRIDHFESEFNIDQLPAPKGDPIGNTSLGKLVQALPVCERLNHSRQVLILDAVRTYYFAKAFRSAIRELEKKLPESISLTTTMISKDLMRVAVLNIASINDQSPRTKSLPNTILVLRLALANSQEEEAKTAISLLDEISRSINPDTQIPLKYVRYMRNKWAGHASLDRQVDEWASADSTLSLPLIEEGLTRLVNAHQDLSEVLNMSEEAQKVLTAADVQPTVIDGVETLPLTFEWSSAVHLAETVRVAAKNSASRIVTCLATGALRA
ncbi:hypothetical protein [Arthrobacter sp. M2012083]|uniref:hypothetical protein n=1 Tax=Arthrobacter sp. M2012083 TaxID=1197706 RepID=UPI00035DEB44|nr:hypothetical protein [Arthrobacter sp. M2012083]